MLKNITLVIAVAACCVPVVNAEEMKNAPHKAGSKQSAHAQGKALDQKWKQQAEIQLHKLMDRNSQNIASSVQSITHSTGKEAKLVSYSVLTLQDRMMVQMTVSWSGGFSNNTYETSLNWELSPSSHLKTTVTGDNAPYVIGEGDLQALNDYFKDTVYPVFVNNMENVSNLWR